MTTSQLSRNMGMLKMVDISYELLEEHGAPHDKTFIMRILVDGEDYGHGIGKSKKDAEQVAAHKAIERLGIDK